MTDTCEWNPEADRAAHAGEHQTAAVWSLGKRPSFHLCAQCVELPRFKRFKRRTWIGPIPGRGDVLVNPDDPSCAWQVSNADRDRVAMRGPAGFEYRTAADVYGWIKTNATKEPTR